MIINGRSKAVLLLWFFRVQFVYIYGMKPKSRGFRASKLCTYEFSTLYTTLPHNLDKEKLVDLIERIFHRKCFLHIACNDRNAFFTSDTVRNYNSWSYQKVCKAATFLLDNIFKLDLAYNHIDRL